MKVRRIKKTGFYQIFCPGCNCFHNINSDPEFFGAFKIEDKNESTFTVSPKLRIPDSKGKTICEFEISNGIIFFSENCQHKFAGKKTSLIDFKNTL